MKYIFEFDESEKEKLAEILRDCIGIDYYESLVTMFFEQVGDEEVLDSLQKQKNGGSGRSYGEKVS